MITNFNIFSDVSTITRPQETTTTPTRTSPTSFPPGVGTSPPTPTPDVSTAHTSAHHSTESVTTRHDATSDMSTTTQNPPDVTTTRLITTYEPTTYSSKTPYYTTDSTTSSKDITGHDSTTDIKRSTPDSTTCHDMTKTVTTHNPLTTNVQDDVSVEIPHWLIALLSILTFILIMIFVILCFAFKIMTRRRYSRNNDEIELTAVNPNYGHSLHPQQEDRSKNESDPDASSIPRTPPPPVSERSASPGLYCEPIGDDLSWDSFYEPISYTNGSQFPTELPMCSNECA